jgi:hypothetical protein
MRARRRSPLALTAVVVAGLLAACTTSGSSPASSASTRSVSSSDALTAAYATAAPGSTIELATGVYAPAQLRRAAGAPTLTLAEPVTLRPASGATVVVRNLDVAGPALRIKNLHMTGIIRFRARAIGSSIDGSRVDPGNVIVEADQVAITGTRLHAPPDRDALDIGATDGTGPTGVQVKDNLIGPGTLTPGSTAHVDCLQVMSAVDLVVADNLLYDCPAQTLLVKADLGPIDGVSIVRNALRGCRPRTSTCPAFMTLQVVPASHSMQDIRLEGNSVAGALRAVAGIPGVVIVGNAIDRVEDGCSYPMTANVVGSSRCTLPGGNRTAAPVWVNPDANPPDLHETVGSPTIDAGEPTMPADKDGQTTPCGSGWDAGAFEHC